MFFFWGGRATHMRQQNATKTWRKTTWTSFATISWAVRLETFTFARFFVRIFGAMCMCCTLVNWLRQYDIHLRWCDSFTPRAKPAAQHLPYSLSFYAEFYVRAHAIIMNNRKLSNDNTNTHWSTGGRKTTGMWKHYEINLINRTTINFSSHRNNERGWCVCSKFNTRAPLQKKRIIW